MAKAQGLSVNSEPEQKVAVLFSRRRGLTVPVEVEELFNEYADVTIDRLPGSSEALLIRKPKGKSRPLLIVSYELTSKSQNRYRFTLAHELGHMILPWQWGTILCHASITYHASDLLSEKIEAEANRFAAELLVPSVWASQRLNVHSDDSLAERVRSMAQAAQVSTEVAVLAAMRVCKADTMLLLVDERGKVTISGTSPNSVLFSRVPGQGEEVDEGQLSAHGLLSKVRVGTRTIYAIDCSNAAVEQLISAQEIASFGNESSKDMLREIVNDIGTDELERKALFASINGVIGSANSHLTEVKEPSVILFRLRQRFFSVSRPQIDAAVHHPRFSQFLSAKSTELAKKR